MHPSIALDTAVLAANARAWKSFAGSRAFYAVVKGNGYGWGVDRVVSAVEPAADAFCVSDFDELLQLRRFTAKPAFVFGCVEDSRVADALELDAQPTMETDAAIAAGIAGGRVRLGVQAAAAWSGSSPERIKELAARLAASQAEVSVWTHVTDERAMDEQIEAFESAVASLRRAGARVASTDVASTYPALAGCAAGSAIRIGIGLFGAGAAAVPGVRCALRVTAPVVKSAHHAAGARVGYGGMMLATAQRITTARCGYADGIPKTLEGSDDIFTVGMQYVTLKGAQGADADVQIIGPGTDLDALAAHCGRLPHEIVTALGNAAR